ncbi:unnamed protein product, partial [Prorocentrum cordatum]
MARGRARRRIATGGGGGVPRISIDSLFVGQKSDLTPLTVPGMKGEERSMVMCANVPLIGFQHGSCPVQWLSECLRMLSFPGLLPKSDGEPTIVDVTSRAKDRPAHESQANGPIEGTSSIIEDLIRCCEDRLDFRCEKVFSSDHPAVAWLVQHVGWVHSLFTVGGDGKTAGGRHAGKRVRIPLRAFGECIL